MPSLVEAEQELMQLAAENLVIAALEGLDASEIHRVLRFKLGFQRRARLIGEELGKYRVVVNRDVPAVNVPARLNHLLRLGEDDRRLVINQVDYLQRLCEVWANWGVMVEATTIEEEA